ncbi:outer membrane homotrimeric porin [Bilophila wadsworthia]|uniref:outer membrane homotrimeric porin n=1 Tax=Bilophila wadsworthia TaxID=35833 RepID=UPI0026751CB9|nr:outer membrane homotrimeric porin [Bilophila wadsworthia]
MKRIVTLLLAAGLVLGAAAGSQAADIKAKGNWTFSWQVGDQTFAKHSGKDNFTAKQRLRTQIDVIASESLKGVLFLEMGDQNWGKSADGASLGTDGKIVKVRYSYVDWVIPQTDAKVRMGLQNFSLPGFISNNPILGGGSADGAGITISGQFTENVGASLFWLRAENDNRAGTFYNGNNYSDAMDFVGLTVPMTFDGVKVTPWAMGGIIGRDSFDNSDNYDQDWGYALSGNVTGSHLQRMLPIGTDNVANSSLDRHGNAWWVGVASELTYFDPFRFALDAAYGSVDMGSYKTAGGKNFDAQRAGWFASILGEYKMDYFTPGVLFWYASGDDSNPYNGSERMPTVEGSWAVSSYGFDDNFGRVSCDMLGLSNDGTMGVYLQAKDISFMEDLTHIFRVGFVKGTNNTEMVRHGGATLTNGGNSLYLTTADKAWEVNFDTQYKIYKDLTLAVELGYINLDLEKGVWGKTVDNYKDNIFRGAVTLQYTF